jgi:LmbE family N-acetylglucosaminyl deacetylase
MSDVIQEVRPSIVYLPNHSDVHTDHQITFRATISCCKIFRAPFIRKILMYECLSETEFALAISSEAFIPNVFVDITDEFLREVEIFKVYESEIMRPPFPRSIESIRSLAQSRGSFIGNKYAQAFCLLFEKINWTKGRL